MASYVTPKINTAYIFYVSLVSQANTKVFQANPTLAAADFNVATNDGAPGALATTPVVDADFTKRVKISLSAGEMNGDNVTVICSDAAGAEWCDLTINIQTTATQVDNLVRSTTPANTLDVSAAGEAGLDWANIGAPTTAQGLTGTTIATSQAVASVSGAVGSVAGNVDGNVTGNVTGTVGSLAAQAKTDVNDQVLDVLNTDTFAEPGIGAPPTPTTLIQKIGYLYKFLRNRVTVTASQVSVYNDDASTVDHKSTHSDDATTYDRGEFTTGA